MKKAYRIVAVAAAWTALSMLTVVVAGCPAPGTGSGATFVGTAVCLQCHDGMLAPGQLEFELSPHRNIECEFCHGSGQAHVKNGGRGGLFITNPEKLPFDQHYQVCDTCHSRQVSQFKVSEHAVFKAAMCFDCHDIHTPFETRLNPLNNELCLQCHAFTDFPGAEEIEAHTHHPVSPATTGASRCTACHMPPRSRENQEERGHDHTMAGVAPIRSVEAAESGVSPVPPNSCAGINGCHDGSEPGEPVFSVDNQQTNLVLQQILETWFGPNAGEVED